MNVSKVLLENGANVNGNDDFQWTPLHYTAEFADNSTNATHVWKKEIAQLLVNKGADINAKSKSKSTPLHIAARAGNFTLISKLFKQNNEYNLALLIQPTIIRWL